MPEDDATKRAREILEETKRENERKAKEAEKERPKYFHETDWRSEFD